VIPKRGSKWRHKKTDHVYVVVGFCMLEATWKMAVLYTPTFARPSDPPIARDLEEFGDGRFVEEDDL